MAEDWEGRALSRRQLLRLATAASTRSDEELNAVLQQLKSLWTNGNYKVMKLFFVEALGLPLHVAFERTRSAGFQADHVTIECVVSLPDVQRRRGDKSAALLSLADFELVLRYWSAFAPETRTWFGVRFLFYLQSKEGQQQLRASGAFGKEVARFRCMWEAVEMPTVAQKLPPDCVCGLEWTDKQTVAFLDKFVDTAGDAKNLVDELHQRGLLDAPLLTTHSDLVAIAAHAHAASLTTMLLQGRLKLSSQKLQPSFALLILRALASELRGGKALSAQHATNLSSLLCALTARSAATNMMFQSIGSVVELLVLLPRNLRGAVLAHVSSCYYEQQALVPDAASSTRNERSEPSYPAFIEALLQHNLEIQAEGEGGGRLEVTVSEWLAHVRTCTTWAATERLQGLMHAWAMAALEAPQVSSEVQHLLSGWVRGVCSEAQTREVWLKAAAAFASWSFLLHAPATILTPPVAGSAEMGPPGLQRAVYEGIAEQRRREVCLDPARERLVRERLAAISPSRFIDDFGIRAYLDIRRPSAQPLWSVLRTSVTAPHTAAEYNDTFCAHSVLAAALQAKPTLEKTKTAEDWAWVTEMVSGLDWALLSSAEAVHRFSSILCAMWSNKASVQAACGVFFGKLLKGLAHSRDAAPLVAFVLNCPHLGDKSAFLAHHLATPTQPPLTPSVVHPLLAAVASSDVHALLRSLHSLGAHGDLQLCGETEDLFYSLLARVKPPPPSARDAHPHASGASSAVWVGSGASTPTAAGSTAGSTAGSASGSASLFVQVQILLGCRFRTTSTLRAARDECVDADPEVWAAIHHNQPAGGGGGEGGEGDGGQHAALGAEPAVLFRQFGARGESLVGEFLRGAQPTQLQQLCGLPNFVATCGYLVRREWAPAMCEPGQEEAMVAVVTTHFAELWPRCVCLVLDQLSLLADMTPDTSEWTVALARTLLGSRTPDLDLIPRRWWCCTDIARISSEEDLVRLVREGDVTVTPGDVPDFASLELVTQQLLITSQWDHVSVLVTWVPLFVGGIAPYLERIFELLEGDKAQLAEQGDGVEEADKVKSGWNKVVNRLLAALRTRAKESENFLHTREQLILFARCCQPLRLDNAQTSAKTNADDKAKADDSKAGAGTAASGEAKAAGEPSLAVDSSNAAILADLMEAACVDAEHLAPLVRFVLGPRRMPRTVRDSALRAMLRLSPADRAALTRQLLDTPSGLQLQVLFALCVASLEPEAVPQVVRQLGMLADDDWEALLLLIRDANPSRGDLIHTFPRSLRPHFRDRFLLAFLRDHNPIQPNASPDPRWRLLFLACAEPDDVAGLLLDAMARELLPLSSEVLDMLDTTRGRVRMSPAQFRSVLEFMSPIEQSLGFWVLPQVWASPAPALCLQHVIDIARAHACESGVLRGVISWKPAEGVHKHGVTPHTDHADTVPVSGQLLTDPELRAVVSAALCSRALWIEFFTTSWRLGVPPPEHRATELLAALPNIVSQGQDKPPTEPLTASEVQQLGVDIDAMRLLLGMSFDLAVRSHGPTLLHHDPTLALRLSSEELARILSLSLASTWPLARRVIAVLTPARALPLAVSLFKVSRDAADLDLVRCAYAAAPAATRRQVPLRTSLGPLMWSYFGRRIQTEVIDPVAVSAEAMSSAVARFEPFPPVQNAPGNPTRP